MSRIWHTKLHDNDESQYANKFMEWPMAHWCSVGRRYKQTANRKPKMPVNHVNICSTIWRRSVQRNLNNNFFDYSVHATSESEVVEIEIDDRMIAMKLNDRQGSMAKPNRSWVTSPRTILCNQHEPTGSGITKNAESFFSRKQ